MKPAWDKLMVEFEGHKTILIGDVDCTAAGKALCDSNGVQGFPTIKHGEPASLEAYKGARDFASLNEFASKLKPMCSMYNIDVCDEEGKAQIKDMQALSDSEIADKIKEGEDKIAEADIIFSKGVQTLRDQYQDISDAKDEAIKAVKASGHGLYKAVLAARKKAGSSSGSSSKDEL